MRVVPKERVIGEGSHYCGWPYVMEHIRALDNGQGVFFDDSLEQSFTFGDTTIPAEIQDNPWVCMAHVSPYPEVPFTNMTYNQYTIFKEGSVEAMKRLRALCTMSEHLAAQFREVAHVPVTALQYPTDTDVPQFDIEAYLNHPRLIHTGWFAKNVRLLWHIPSNPYIQEKIYVSPGQFTVNIAHYMSAKYRRQEYDDVKVVPWLPTTQYNQLLLTSVSAIEFLPNAAASTVVVEALARCAPILVNKHPTVIEYLGADYPMLFDNVRDCSELLQPDNVVRAHEYLKNLDKGFLSVSKFIEQFQQWVTQYE